MSSESGCKKLGLLKSRNIARAKIISAGYKINVHIHGHELHVAGLIKDHLIVSVQNYVPKQSHKLSIKGHDRSQGIKSPMNKIIIIIIA